MWILYYYSAAVLWLSLVNILPGRVAQMLPPLPPTPCPELFQYVLERGRIIGQITFPTVIVGTTRLRVQLAQSTPITDGYVGNITSYGDKLVDEYKQVYRVKFPTNEIPKVNKITVNDVDVCVAKDYDPEFSNGAQILVLLHNLTYTEGTMSRPGTLLTTRQIGRWPNSERNTIEYEQEVYRNSEVQKSPPTRIISTQPPLPFIPVTPSATTIQTYISPTRTNMLQLRRTNADNCGRQLINFEPYIFGGRNLKVGEFPWITPIYRHYMNSLQFQCGGSIISTRTIITAAHCVRNALNLTAADYAVSISAYNLRKFSESNAEIRDIEDILVHPDFSPNRFSADADIALLFVEGEIRYTNYVQPVCLWSQSDDLAMIINETGYIAGWGNDGKNRITNLPKLATVSIMTLDVCRRERAFEEVTTDRTICTGITENSGPCNGDSGGGLLLNFNGRWTLRGILSGGGTIGHQCDLTRNTIFCDVAKHIVWIRRNMLP